MILKSFNIKNFRRFTDLELNNLKQVNVIVGNNGIGKTSLLDALFLLLARKNQNCSYRVQNFRGMTVNTDSDFKYLFKDFKFNNEIYLSGELFENNKLIDLAIKPVFKYTKLVNDGINNNITLEQQEELVAIEYIFKDLNGQPFKQKFSIQAPVPLFPHKVEYQGSYFHTSCMFINNVCAIFDNVVKDNKEKYIVEILNKIDNRIQDIKMGANNTILINMKGIQEAVPFYVIGGGIQKIILILANIISHKNGFLLIDELENGLHYTSLKVLLQAIFIACKMYNVQLFITTHSKETIDSLIKVSDDNDFKDIVNITRLDYKNDKYYATAYTDEMLDTVYEENVEIR